MAESTASRQYTVNGVTIEFVDDTKKTPPEHSETEKEKEDKREDKREEEEREEREEEIDPEIMRRSITVRGLSGLRNIGNTCYMNSALQCLSACTLFTGYMINKKFFHDLKHNTIIKMKEDVLKKREKQKEKEAGEKGDKDKKEEKEEKEESNLELSVGDDVVISLKKLKKKLLESVTYNYYRLVKKMYEDNYKVTPRSFKNSVGTHNIMFRGSQQHDAQEFLNWLIDAIHEELKTPVSVHYRDTPKEIVDYISTKKSIRESFAQMTDPEARIEHSKCYEDFIAANPGKEIFHNSHRFWAKFVSKNHSVMIDLFTGSFCTSRTCKVCGKTSNTFEAFNMLQLQIPEKASTLEECVEDFSKPHLLEGDNQYYCGKCKANCDATQKIHVWDVPEILIIHLKRFKHVGGRSSTKNSTFVKAPLNELKLDALYSEYRHHDYSYELVGIVRHFGSLSGGHYIALTKNVINNSWYEFNDDDVKYIPEEDYDEEVQSKDNYIFFYKKKVPETDDDTDGIKLEGETDDEPIE